MSTKKNPFGTAGLTALYTENLTNEPQVNKALESPPRDVDPQALGDPHLNKPRTIPQLQGRMNSRSAALRRSHPGESPFLTKKPQNQQKRPKNSQFW